MDNVVKIGEFKQTKQPGLTLDKVDLAGEDILAAWCKGAAGVAEALGINVTIMPTPDARVSIAVTRFEPYTVAKLLGSPG